MRWHDQLEEGHLPPELEGWEVPTSPGADRSRILEVLNLAARFAYIADCAQARISGHPPEEADLRKHDPLLYDALHALSLVDLTHMLRGAHRQASNRKVATRGYRAAVIELLRRILRETRARTIPDIVYRLGTKNYRETDWEGTRYELKRLGECLEIHEVGSPFNPIRVQPLRKEGRWTQAVRNWITEAKEGIPMSPRGG